MLIHYYINKVSEMALKAENLTEVIELMQAIKDEAIQDDNLSVDEIIVIKKLADMYCDIHTGILLKKMGKDLPFKHITKS